MAELIEAYLHSREIQLKLEAATKPKIKPVNELVNSMFYCGLTPPANPKQGDMYLNLDSGQSVCYVYDGERFIVVGSAYDRSTTVPAGYPYERSYVLNELRPGFSSVQVNLSEEELREFRESMNREWATNPQPILTAAPARLVTVGPGVITEIADLPPVQLEAGAPINVDTISRVNRNGRRYIGSSHDADMSSYNRYPSIEHRAMDSNVVPMDFQPPDGITRTGYSLPPDGIMRTSHLEGASAKHTHSMPGTLNAEIDMDIWRSLLGGE